ncbi:MAG: amidase [Hyphomicrobiaceae bacterium]|nr:amidase [Hyphomicrobiaceae bacterium]
MPTSAVAEITRTLELIDRENGRLNAFVRVLGETAKAEAQLVDARIRAGDDKRPLAGMPVAVKDIIDVAGVVSGCGSLTRRNAAPASADAPVVERLRAAGAVVPGKTHTVEFAFGGYGTNITVGTPWNPWDRKVHRIPGGSSSGSGVAVGAGLVPAALGTDTGGSVRIPAALCGCVGLKTSVGRVGRSGVAPLSQLLDSVGPLARDVTTAARVFAVMQGPDPADPTTAAIAPADPMPDLERGVAGLRIGRIADADLPMMSEETRADFVVAVGHLAKLGARIDEVKLPGSIDDWGNLCGQFIAAECYATWQALADDPSSGLADPIRARMLSGSRISAAHYIQMLRARAVATAGFLSAIDRLDALVLPTTPFPAIPVAEVDERRAPMALYTRWVNYLDLAGLAVPTTISRGGLPMSLQIVVRRLEEPLALRIGRAFEVARGAFSRPV